MNGACKTQKISCGMKKFVFHALLRLCFIIFSLGINYLYGVFFRFINRKYILCIPGNYLNISIACSTLLCICIGGFISYRYIKDEQAYKHEKKLILLFFCFALIPTFLLSDKVVITQYDAYHSIFGNILKQHELTQANNINITFHNKSTKSFFSTDTLSYDFSYGEIEFNLEVDMYNDRDIDALLFLHENVSGEETKIVIELGSAQNNINAKKIKESFEKIS